MSRLNIFQRFSQKENTITDNVLLLFSHLYENSPSIYNEFFSQIFEDDNLYSVSPSFRQQLGKGGKGIIDGNITSKSSSIVIETKRHGLESITKLLKYTDRFNNEDSMILLQHLSMRTKS